MNRRIFFRNSIGFLSLAALPNNLFSPPENEKNSLKLIRELRQFGEGELGLNLNRKFYKRWLKQEQQLTYLYVSRADSILLPQDTPSFRYFGTDTASAAIKAKEVTDEGFDTMLYKTSGTSATLLTHHLLNYPPEAIMFIVMHEMSHVHRQRMKIKIPYQAEESFGEFLGNYATIEFAKKYHPEFIPALLKQSQIQENIYTLLSEAEIQLQGLDNEIKLKRYKEVQKALNKLLEQANPFQKDRYQYPVNHAYILRNRFYYNWYPNFKKLYLSGNSMEEMINIYSNLPESESEASTYLKLKVKNLKP
ncbi:MAG: aminopeptidase [Bacteroidia bacterium]